ncbi:arsenic transporter [Herbaspirillum frisingense]|uniref:arsenic transporter n=1 Tax=Herbaspirillum frisingense TaxID=92645 RepID=UPI0016003AE6|nr:arsenic transporter [Herbaspirillum frisingense]QNB06096.1 arsenic transporter [Herbaspirillum frisingense]
MIFPSHLATWIVAATATAGVILRPWRTSEALWTTIGALILVTASLVPWQDAIQSVARGTDVYLFLAGMMLLAELAREEGVFDWLAGQAARHAVGSAERLFALVFAIATVVTIFLSNDATAVVLTPAVHTVAKSLKAKPLPYLLICAFVANAASFALPVSNPANLVVFGAHMPSLVSWISRFGLASVLSVLATYAVLRWHQCRALRDTLSEHVALSPLTTNGKLASLGLLLTSIVLLGASMLGARLGMPTFLCALVCMGMIFVRRREMPWQVLRGVAWNVFPLLAGMFVLVMGLDQTGAIADLSQLLRDMVEASASWAAPVSGMVTALACNLFNNLPAALIAGTVVNAGGLSTHIVDAILVGIDLGPNLSMTGSLATLLWLVSLRREGIRIGNLQFLSVGCVIMFPALLLALMGIFVTHPS